MTANSFGQIFRVTSFGESHGSALGCVIEGCPAGINFDLKLLQDRLEQRRPGRNSMVSQRNEADQVEVLSGVFAEKTLGTPICLMVRNQDARPEDYEKLKSQNRPGHADDVWQVKFGHRDHRGGGRSSGRETVARVMAGAVAEMLVKCLAPELRLIGYLSEAAQVKVKRPSNFEANFYEKVLASPLRCEDGLAEKEIGAKLLQAREQGLSYGGVAEIYVSGVPAGLGQPVFHKLKADLAAAYLSVGATSALEIGDGFAATGAEGSVFHQAEAGVYGGMRGGISTGEPWFIRVGFKPTSSVLAVAQSGRHDPCIVPRAIPVLEAMTFLVLADHLLWRRLDQI